MIESKNEKEVNDAIDAWHDSDSNKTLIQWLGWTQEKWDRFSKGDDVSLIDECLSKVTKNLKEKFNLP